MKPYAIYGLRFVERQGERVTEDAYKTKFVLQQLIADRDNDDFMWVDVPVDKEE